MKLRYKIILGISIPLLALFILANCVYWSLTEVRVSTSPTGEYSIKMYWTDVGGWGWVGKIYVVEHGFIDKRHWTGLRVPAMSRWLSDYEFEIYDGSWQNPTRVYSVYDFID